MKDVIESLGEVITELVGLVGVATGLYSAILLLRTFGDNFIQYFI